jgi:quinol monooxygenase YgiN
VQEARDAFQRLVPGGRRKDGAAEELETAAAQRARKQCEALVVEALVDQAVERSVARDGNAGRAVVQQLSGNFCMFQECSRYQPGP